MNKVITGCNNCPNATLSQGNWKTDGGYCYLRPVEDRQVSTGDFLASNRPPRCPLPNPVLGLLAPFKELLESAKDLSDEEQAVLRQHIGNASKELQSLINSDWDDEFYASKDAWMPSLRNC